MLLIFSTSIVLCISPRLRVPEQLTLIPRPRLLFTGAIDAYKLDLPMTVSLARTNPNWSFVFVGPVGEADPSTELALP